MFIYNSYVNFRVYQIRDVVLNKNLPVPRTYHQVNGGTILHCGARDC